MKLFEEFKLYETMWDELLTEAKADTQKLIDFVGLDLANRYEAIKRRLRAPENDLYYWIKNKTPEELETFISNIEASSATKHSTKTSVDSGAKLVCETDHWKVYYITTYEASVKYGRDAKWCISGTGEGGRYAWDLRNHAKIYFFISKLDYDPRGTDSKFALVIYNTQLYDVFDQQDTNVETLDQIPDIEEVTIPGIDFTSIEPAYGDDGLGVCDSCGTEYHIEDLYCLDNNSGYRYCSDCYDDWNNPADLDEYGSDVDEDEEETHVTFEASSEDLNNYRNYTEESLVGYKIYWSRYPYNSSTIARANIPFKQAVSEILEAIDGLDDALKSDYGISVSCYFLSPSGRDAEAFYTHRLPSDMSDVAELRFNSRSVSLTPDFVQDAGKKIAEALGAASIKINDTRHMT
jgi:hypothetical protein